MKTLIIKMSTQGYWSNINNIIALRYLWYRFPRKLLADCRTTFGRHSPHSCLTAGQYSANSQKQTCVKFFTSCGPTELCRSSCSLLSRRGQLKLKTEKVHTFTSRKKSNMRNSVSWKENQTLRKELTHSGVFLITLRCLNVWWNTMSSVSDDF